MYMYTMEKLPIEMKRKIVKFIPRHPTAQMIYDSRHRLSLTYIRRYNFENDFPATSLVRRMFIWEDLKPSNLKSTFYGDAYMIIRSNISRGQYIQLRHLGITS